MNWCLLWVSFKATCSPIQILKKEKKGKKKPNPCNFHKESLEQNLRFLFFRTALLLLMLERYLLGFDGKETLMGSSVTLDQPQSQPWPSPLITNEKKSSWGPSLGLWGERVHAGCSSWGPEKPELPSFYLPFEWDLENILGNSCSIVVKGFKWWQNEAIFISKVQIHEGS